jgi:hypothetical protein
MFASSQYFQSISLAYMLVKTHYGRSSCLAGPDLTVHTLTANEPSRRELNLAANFFMVTSDVTDKILTAKLTLLLVRGLSKVSSKPRGSELT